MGSRIDEPLTMTRSSTTYYYNTDGLGNVRQILNSSGTIVESYDYDPYGGTTIYDSSLTDITSSGSGIDNPYMYTGRRFDEETGIYHYRARQYDPAIGRFLQRDPLGYASGMNPFEYTWSNPINFTDPMGLFPEQPVGAPYPDPGDPPMCPLLDDDPWFPEQENPYAQEEEEEPMENQKDVEPNWPLVGMGLLEMAIGTGIAIAGGAIIIGTGGAIGGAALLVGVVNIGVGGMNVGMGVRGRKKSVGQTMMDAIKSKLDKIPGPFIPPLLWPPIY